MIRKPFAMTLLESNKLIPLNKQIGISIPPQQYFAPYAQFSAHCITILDTLLTEPTSSPLTQHKIIQQI